MFSDDLFLVGAVDLHRYTQIKWEKTINTYKPTVLKAEKEKKKAEKEKEASESQFTVLKSEKIALTKAVEEAKAAKDEAFVMANPLKFEQERLVRMAKEKAKEKVSRAISERDDAITALEAEKADQKVKEESIREEAVRKIVDYGMLFRRSALFMVKEKYPDLDFSDISFSNMRGLKKEGGNVQVVIVERVEEPVQGEEAQTQTVEVATIDPQILGVESIVNDVDESSLVNVPSD